jgi:protein O-mannosyl-transferase
MPKNQNRHSTRRSGKKNRQRNATDPSNAVEPGSPSETASPVERRASPMVPWIAIGILLLVTCIVYWQVATFDFIRNYDDMIYVADNSHVKSGLTASNIRWAFTTPCAGNWHPLTMLSHMLDCQLFGVTPAKHHLVNLLFHLINTALLFLVLFIATKHSWASGFVAALFALHPLHVESVAWIAERKDVLSTFFWLLTMWAYFQYVKKKRLHIYALMLVAFACGLMAKPMLVTLPFVLILMDWWPLKRLSVGRPGIPEKSDGTTVTLINSVVEKIPLFALTLCSIWLTIHAQKGIGALTDMIHVPFAGRVCNALVSAVIYIVKFFVPIRLAPFYPHPVTIPALPTIGAAIVLLTITAIVFIARRKAHYALVGWLWFLGTLVPVIGIVQVGSQAMADRYTYIPHIGVYIACTWLLFAAAKKWRFPRLPFAGLLVGILLIFSIVTWRQLRFWKNDETLFKHCIEVNQQNFVAYNNYAVEILNRGNVAVALSNFQKAVEINPRYADAWCNVGILLKRQGKFAEAETTFLRGLRVAPDHAKMHFHLATTYVLLNRLPESFPHFDRALASQSGEPDILNIYSSSRNNYGVILIQSGDLQGALAQFEQATRLNPGNKTARDNVAKVREYLLKQSAGRK